MIEYRSFLNTDLPGVVKVWRQQRPHRAFSQSMFNDLFERLVLSKPIFDPKGLIVALQNDVIVGFVHCSFGPTEDRQDLDQSNGILSILLTAPGPQKAEVCQGLIECAERYLKGQGSERVVTGTVFPASPFYLGLYGGSNVPGILSVHKGVIRILESMGYRRHSEILVMQRHLQGFRAVLDRKLTLIGRSFRIEQDQDPIAQNWWEACTLGNTNRSVFRLIERRSEAQRGSICYWDVEPLARNWGVQAMGLFDLRIDRDLRQESKGTYLVSESLRCMQMNGITLVEAQVEDDNVAAKALFEKLGFEVIDKGVVLEKALV